MNVLTALGIVLMIAALVIAVVWVVGGRGTGSGSRVVVRGEPLLDEPIEPRNARTSTPAEPSGTADSRMTRRPVSRPGSDARPGSSSRVGARFGPSSTDGHPTSAA